LAIPVTLVVCFVISLVLGAISVFHVRALFYLELFTVSFSGSSKLKYYTSWTILHIT